MSSGAALPRDKLTGLLWSDRGDIQVRDSLKHALKHLSQAFNDAVPEQAGVGLIVTTDRHEVRLAVDWSRIVVWPAARRCGRGTPLVASRAWHNAGVNRTEGNPEKAGGTRGACRRL